MNIPKNLKSVRRSANPKEQVLSEWRRVNLAPWEKMQANPAQSAGDLMPRVLAGIGLDRRRAETEILKVWHHLLDPQIVAHARPTRLHQGTLFVAVDNNAWLDEIVRYRRREILERLQHSFGRDLIARICFRIG